MKPNRWLRMAFGLALTGTVALSAGHAFADAQQTQSFAVWKQMQECAKTSMKQFPDHTVESNAKREAMRQECLRAHRLPVTQPVSPPPAQ
jgi:hypothetical protein